MSYQTFQARVLPRLMAPAAPFGRSPFESAQGGAHPFGLYKAAQRSSRFTTRQLARALARAADVDVALKNSAAAARDAVGLRRGAGRGHVGVSLEFSTAWRQA